ncbi:MAG: LacI family transcriptional regulator [Actinobacteria bacterium]|nr:LacI family transcriptional regulator [Actinomycetota bacterium]
MERSDSARPTGLEVARLAGVAQSSVSLVFSGKAQGRISPALERRIRDAATQLGYEPIHVGRALRSGEVGALGLVVTDFENAFFGPVSRGAQEAAAEAGLAVVLMEDRASDPVRSLDRGLVDGLLVFAVDPPEPTDRLAARVTLLEVVHPAYSGVVFDSADGMRQAVRHLNGLGHGTIGYAGVDTGRWTFRERRASWERAMADAGLPVDGRVAESAITLEAATAAARGLLAGASRPTAVVCADDLVTAGVYRAAAELGLRVPDDLSVVGFGGTIVGEVLSPAVTTLYASGRALGRVAVELALGRPSAPERRVVPVELRPGASTAVPGVPA